jgi:hypothetical protein
LLLSGCLQPFTPPEISGGRGLLVVDGFLNAGGDTTVIHLMRTQNLADSAAPPPEGQAQVTVEGERGDIYRLTETRAGRYVLPGAPVSPDQQYRLRIRTSGGEYLSDYVPVKRTPPIDSVNWEVTGDGVQVYVNTHDPAADTRYYRWEFTETWEFNSPFTLWYMYEKGTLRFIEENTTKCWQSETSPRIALGTSARLSEDIIYQYPLLVVPANSEKHQIRYSVLVKQYGLTREGYDYWQNLKRNTEERGTLFDPQPSQMSSNIRSVNNPEEPVMGFFSAGSVAEKRIFIRRNQLPIGWLRITGYETCQIDTLTYVDNPPEVLEEKTFPVFGQILGPAGGYLTSDVYCVDCRLRGDNKQPAFW